MACASAAGIIFPVNIIFGGMWNELTLRDSNDQTFFIETSYAGFIAATHRMGPIEGFAALQLEQSSVDVGYFSAASGTTLFSESSVKFSLDGSNTLRAVVGGKVQLGLVSIATDFGIGNVKTFSFGAGIGL